MLKYVIAVILALVVGIGALYMARVLVPSDPPPQADPERIRL
jgi:hypothetical protein